MRRISTGSTQPLQAAWTYHATDMPCAAFTPVSTHVFASTPTAECRFIMQGISAGGEEDFIEKIRQANIKKENSYDYGSLVIGVLNSYVKQWQEKATGDWEGREYDGADEVWKNFRRGLQRKWKSINTIYCSGAEIIASQMPARYLHV